MTKVTLSDHQKAIRDTLKLSQFAELVLPVGAGAPRAFAEAAGSIRGDGLILVVASSPVLEVIWESEMCRIFGDTCRAEVRFLGFRKAMDTPLDGLRLIVVDQPPAWFRIRKVDAPLWVLKVARKVYVK